MNTYNNEAPAYEVQPLPKSDLEKIVVFAGKVELTPRLRDRETFLYLETKVLLNDSNGYGNLRILSYLIELATGLFSEPIYLDISELTTFEEVLDKYKAERFHEPGVSYGGMVNDDNPIMKIPLYSKYLNCLVGKDIKKFENALQTYIWAQEIQRLPNPQLHYTLYMTLFLSSIDQLAENPRPVHPACTSRLVCPDCGETLNMKHSTSHVAEIERLIRSLITGNDVDVIVARVKKLYHQLRSNFLHDGLLSGGERDGGFLAGITSEIELMEDMANLTTLNRKLLELFLQDRAKQTP